MAPRLVYYLPLGISSSSSLKGLLLPLGDCYSLRKRRCHKESSGRAFPGKSAPRCDHYFIESDEKLCRSRVVVMVAQQCEHTYCH